MSRLCLAIAVALAVLTSAQAQHAPASPYSGWEHRSVKALSNEQIADLRAGRGMGLALPAELNGYPGPVHVLELGDQLRLTREQRTRMQELHDAMQAEPIPLGESLIGQEADLERQFASKSVTPVSLQAATAEIGAMQGALRLAHLRYHLSTLDVLTPRQVRRYSELRGYQASEAHGADEGDDVQAELVLGQRQGALALGPVRLVEAGAADGLAPADLETQAHRSGQRHKSAVVLVADAHRQAAGRAQPTGGTQHPLALRRLAS